MSAFCNDFSQLYITRSQFYNQNKLEKYNYMFLAFYYTQVLSDGRSEVCKVLDVTNTR